MKLSKPESLQHFAQSFVRAYKISMTPPYGPVMMSLDMWHWSTARST